MYPDNNGPQLVIIPEQRFLQCNGCKYHDHRLVRSGRNPVYFDNCIHPNVERRQFEFSGNLDNHKKGWSIQTPDWCPFIPGLNMVATIKTEM